MEEDKPVLPAPSRGDVLDHREAQEVRKVSHFGTLGKKRYLDEWSFGERTSGPAGSRSPGGGTRVTTRKSYYSDDSHGRLHPHPFLG